MLRRTVAWRRAWLAALMIAMLGANAVQTQSDLLRKDLLLRRFSFRVEIEGIDAGFFRSVGGLAIETEVIEFREGGSDVIRKLPGVRKYPNLVLKRGFTWRHRALRVVQLVHQGESGASQRIDRHARAQPVPSWRDGNSTTGFR